jgi:ferrous iron transport protein A
MPDINLRQMKKNQSGTITSIKTGGELGLRIREMGLVPGTRITIQGRAPLNDPVALRVMGGVLTLRNNEADHITVTVDDKDWPLIPFLNQAITLFRPLCGASPDSLYYLVAARLPLRFHFDLEME